MSTNMTLITSVTVGSGGAASVTLPASGTIPQTYTDLKVVCSTRQSGNADGNQMGIRFNGSSASEYSRRLIYGDGSGAFSGSGSSESFARIAFAESSTYTANTFNNFEIYIPNYTSSNFKSFSSDAVSENNATNVYAQALYAGLWSNTAAITSITLSEYSGSGTNFVEGSTFYLYGISNVTSTTKATGGIVSSDGTYNYHMFPYSGTFTPTQNITADYLVIGGGGGGSVGGGGAGGYRTSIGGTPLSLTAQSYSVIVGAGGAVSTKGDNSTFSTITSTGGGRGGNGGNGGTGGSGGGGDNTVGAIGGLGNEGGYSPSEGNNGGTRADGVTSGGGGGAGAVGGNGVATGSIGGAGGNGSNSASTWATATQTGINGYYAGGGGGGGQGTGPGSQKGGVGGIGGGGAGETNGVRGISGIANTGSGGGGGYYIGAGTGGSGLVIIRYAI